MVASSVADVLHTHTCARATCKIRLFRRGFAMSYQSPPFIKGSFNSTQVDITSLSKRQYRAISDWREPGAARSIDLPARQTRTTNRYPSYQTWERKWGEGRRTFRTLCIVILRQPFSRVTQDTCARKTFFSLFFPLHPFFDTRSTMATRRRDVRDFEPSLNRMTRQIFLQVEKRGEGRQVDLAENATR